MGISWDFMAIFMATVVPRCIVNSCAEVYSQGILTLLKLSRGDLVGGLCPIDGFSRSFRVRFAVSYGYESKPWYLVNPKIAGIYGCSSH